MPRKYVKLRFPNGRLYTYHTDHEASVGDFFQVQTNAGASLELEVAEVTTEMPQFPTKLAIKASQ